MGLSKISERCNRCSKAGNCDSKRMEACGYLFPCPEHRHGGLATNVVLCDEIEHSTVIPKNPAYEDFLEQLYTALEKASNIPRHILSGQHRQITGK